jgi:2-polyprenyl-3-methyl-5-hydroxy-6-metoxy-1,4-benzoquinol methylase
MTLKTKIKSYLRKKYFNTPDIKNEHIRNVVKHEYNSQTYSTFNERPVEYSFVFKQLSIHCPITILDVGTGLTALPHLMRSCGFKVTAIDNVKDYWTDGMINRHYFVIDDDITDSKLNEKFDLITCISTLEHIENSDKAIQNMVNLLNPGGKLVLTFPYNEKKYCPNVYKLADSKAPKNMPFVTQAYSREQLNTWSAKYKLEIIEQEYWAYFTGEYWTVGDRLAVPIKSSQTQNHQISCVVLKKN